MYIKDVMAKKLTQNAEYAEGYSIVITGDAIGFSDRTFH